MRLTPSHRWLLASTFVLTIATAWIAVRSFDGFRADVSSSTGLPTVMNVAPLTQTYCDDSFRALEDTAENDRTGEATYNLWTMLQPEWRNAVMDQCSERISAADTCRILALKLTFTPSASQDIMTLMQAKGCFAGPIAFAVNQDLTSTGTTTQAASSKAATCNLDTTLNDLTTEYAWQPGWNAHYPTQRLLLNAKLSYAAILQDAITVGVSSCNSCDDLEATMGKSYDFLPDAKQGIPKGLSLFTKNALYTQYLAKNCLVPWITSINQQTSSGGIALDNDVFTVPSSATGVDIVVLRDGPLKGVGSVQYATWDDTAMAGFDYTETKGTLKFVGDERVKTIRVPITMNLALQDSKTFDFTISDPSGNVVISAPFSAKVYIQGYGASSVKGSYVRSSSGGEGTRWSCTIIKKGKKKGTKKCVEAGPPGSGTGSAVEGTGSVLPTGSGALPPGGPLASPPHSSLPAGGSGPILTPETLTGASL